MFGAPPHHLAAFSPFDSTKMDKLDPMQNQMCRVCSEPAAGFHFGAFTCEGCKSFFGRTCNNQSVIQECKNNYRCVINKKNRTACKACRLRKCLMVGMSKSGSRYGRRSNWFKIHCLMQQASETNRNVPSSSSTALSAPTPPPSTVVPQRTNNLSSPPLWRPLDSPSPKASPPPPPSTKSLPSTPKVQSPSHGFSFVPVNKTKDPLDSPPSSAPITTPTSSSSSVAAAAAMAMATSPFTFPTSLYSPFGSALPFMPPTFNIPGLSALPIHKQALLSPLLASSHFLAAARKAYPFLPTTTTSTTSAAPTETTDVLAEHKALLERFRASAAAMAAAAALNNNKEEDEKSTASTPPTTSKEPGLAMDLTKRSSSEDSVSSVGSEIIPHLSDTDEDEAKEDLNEESSNNVVVKKRKDSEMPLDLTCV